jgi:hypothetical protein
LSNLLLFLFLTIVRFSNAAIDSELLVALK